MAGTGEQPEAPTSIEIATTVADANEQLPAPTSIGFTGADEDQPPAPASIAKPRSPVT
ncbi:hypothetical protein ACHAXT_003921 [Thalassiosira profunda]